MNADAPASLFGMLADAVLLLHAAFVAFVIFGLVLTWIGYFTRWVWVRNPWFRFGHLVAIAIVVLQAWAGWICPLTIWERELRQAAGQPVNESSFIAYWLHELLFYTAPVWVFTLAYTIFGALVVLTWIVCPPSHHGVGRP